MAAMAGTALFGFGSSAMADSTFDLVEALVEKGILTEEEALPLLKSRANEEKAQTKKMEKAMDDKFPVKASYGSKGFRLMVIQDQLEI
jgi:polyhydroxyalkanoate synthesis regulator phasin